MEGVASELAKRLREEYERRQEPYKESGKEAADYVDVSIYAIQAGDNAAEVFKSILTDDVPGGRMTFTFAVHTLQPVLLDLTEDVLLSAESAQEKLNGAAGIRMAFQVPDTARPIDGILNTAISNDWENIRDTVCQSTREYAGRLSDDCIKANADVQSDAGMRPQLIRTASATACKDCRLLAGTYDYEQVRREKNVFWRHNNCTCVIEYVPRKGLRQNVHTKKWEDESRAKAGENDTVEVVKSQKNYWRDAEDVTGAYLRRAMPGAGRYTIVDGAQKEQEWKENKRVSVWIHDNLGGDLKCLKRTEKKKSPDFEWRGKLWELKTVSTVKAVDAALRTGIHQIRLNQGGVILDFGDNEVDFGDVAFAIGDRIRQHSWSHPDVMILARGELIRVLRYK